MKMKRSEINLIMLQSTWNLAPVDAYENYIVNS